MKCFNCSSSTHRTYAHRTTPDSPQSPAECIGVRANRLAKMRHNNRLRSEREKRLLKTRTKKITKLPQKRRTKSGPSPPHPRPKTFGECTDIPDNCPYVGCRHNLKLDVTAAGSIVEYDITGQLCSIKRSVNNPHTLEQVGQVLGVTRERTRQIEAKVLIKLRKQAKKGKIQK